MTTRVKVLKAQGSITKITTAILRIRGPCGVYEVRRDFLDEAVSHIQELATYQ